MTGEKFMAAMDALLDLNGGGDDALRHLAKLLREPSPDPHLLR